MACPLCRPAILLSGTCGVRSRLFSLKLRFAPLIWLAAVGVADALDKHRRARLKLMRLLDRPGLRRRARVKTVIEGRQRWNVRRWLVLGHFAFGRSAMYADLNPQNWKVDPQPTSADRTSCNAQRPFSPRYGRLKSSIRGVDGTAAGHIASWRRCDFVAAGRICPAAHTACRCASHRPCCAAKGTRNCR